METETQKRKREGPAKKKAEPCPEQNEAMLSTAACPRVRPRLLQHTMAEGKRWGCMREGENKRRKGSWEVWNATGVLTDRIYSESSQHLEPKACPCGDGDAEARRGSASFTGQRAIATTPLRRRSGEAAKGPLQGLALVGIFANRILSESPMI